MLRLDRDQVMAFRLDGHHLNYRRPFDALLEVATACGVRNTPPGSAALALHARVAGLPADALEAALRDDHSLVEILGMRISPWIVPARDVGVFTLGALPATEESLLAVLHSLAPSLKATGITATEALRLASQAAHEELDGRMLARGALSAAMTRRLPEALCPWCRACGVRHVGESLFRLTGVSGVFVVGVRPDKGSVYARTDQWLGAGAAPGPEGDDGAARATLLRRYLRCFGPSTLEHVAAWTGVTPADARRAWDDASDHLVAVELEGRHAWLHADDVSRLDGLAPASGVRLLPPYDAYLDQRDRATLLPEKGLHRRVWAALGNPGVVLAEGQIAGTWRPRKTGKRLSITVEAFAPLSQAIRDEVEAEAALLAPHRGCASAEVVFAE